MLSVRIFGTAKAKDTIKRVKRKEINPLFHSVFFCLKLSLPSYFA